MSDDEKIKRYTKKQVCILIGPHLEHNNKI